MSHAKINEHNIVCAIKKYEYKTSDTVTNTSSLFLYLTYMMYYSLFYGVYSQNMETLLFTNIILIAAYCFPVFCGREYRTVTFKWSFSLCLYLD